VHALQLGRAYPRFAAHDYALLILLPETLERADRVARLLRAKFPVLADPKRTVFRSYGYRRRWFLMQQSGTALVDRDGTLSYIRRATSPRRALDMDELIRAIEGGQP
jgi:peroxiredoxin